MAIRKDLKEHNKHLVNAASDAGVKTSIDYARFQNFGYKGLYGGLDAKGIHTKKGLEKNQKILDHFLTSGKWSSFIQVIPFNKNILINLQQLCN